MRREPTAPGGPAQQSPTSGPAPTPGPPTPEPAVGVRRTRVWWVSGIASALVLAVASALLLVRPGPLAGWLGAGPAASQTATANPEPAPTPVLAAANAESGVVPTGAGIAAAIEPLVKAKALGTGVGVSVVDAVTGEALYQHDADNLRTPASTTKLITAATVLAARGPAYRLTTRVVAGDEPGEVVLIGGGDPTLAVDENAQFPGAARLDRLAAQVTKALGGHAPTKVLIDTSLFVGPTTGTGWSSGLISPEGQVAAIQSLMTNAGRRKPVHHEYGGDPRYSDPALSAGRLFAEQLGVNAPVKRGKAPAAPTSDASTATPASDASAADPDGSAAAGNPAPGTELGSVQSPPLVHIVDWMLQQSDNVIAETMGRQVALAAGRPASFEGATQSMIAKLNELGLPGDEADLYDASGLSYHDGISPTLLTGLLAMAAGGGQPVMGSIFGGLPVAGWSGTLEDRFATPTPNRVGQGVVRAKTGSLSGVNTMAGELVTKDGRLLMFAVLADQTGPTSAARSALDKIVAGLVGCGC
ncbi:D-alanyl-D-alanine carboxypeptidase/D-alanyl-D-alanine endopeptidase [Mangrovihabitans endophyticus]|nr:D-alanyl-D-alanine carboxypeptidase/D-alanyl-D-alanine-endopeptidase [Mangrovihabitans endophyticus]